MNIHSIDLNFQGFPQSIAAYLIESDGELALVETGPSSTLNALLAGIRHLGYAPEAIRKVLVTHVHLDHAGAAGWWAQQGARVFVHARGAKHLVDPARLVEGARLVYGDRLHALWGDIIPVSAERVTSLVDGDSVTVGRTCLQAWDTPGHAYHHLAFVVDGIAFTGDVAGVRIAAANYTSAATAPSQFDPEAYLKSIDRLRAARLDRLCLTHFGAVDDSAEHLANYAETIRAVTGLVRAHVRNGAPPAEVVEAFTAFNRARAGRAGCDEADWQQYENANPSAMCAAGILHYLNRR